MKLTDINASSNLRKPKSVLSFVLASAPEFVGRFIHCVRPDRVPRATSFAVSTPCVTTGPKVQDDSRRSAHG